MSPYAFADSPIQDSDAPRPGLLERVHLDAPLLLGLLAVAALGLVILYSASQKDFDAVSRQAMRLAMGFGVLIVLAQIPPRLLQAWTPWLYAIGNLLLVAVLLVGEVSMGAQRWLDLGVVRFQPSEIMKIAVPLMLAWFFADKTLPPRIPHLLVGALVAGVPFALIAKQPDLGTGLVVLSAGLFALFLGGMSWKIIFTLLGMVGAIAPLFWEYGMREYQRQRVRTLFDPEADPLGAGYHIIQSKIAIGSGGIYGKGWLNGTQSHLDFLPESHTDFILGTFAEEFGLIGVCVLLTLYFFIIARALWLASRAEDTFGRLTGGTLALVFFFYAFVNTGMVSGILPVVGVPLPLVSYGGTSLVTIMAGFGILMSVSFHRRRCE
ncbi:rod shape-determining protein RodA [Plasticicumulans acidivorans]|uniref:Peptidoglycan glycosyltransferase MrdB n=1 Tax=Plasticicumulans acidivorans TaxID=886464 RepID=A0A317MQ39_9GAMM|nr:rod shape-determining protein RodA [Plasticicumulans acidivorans]PWV58385.1 cell elongation-specific peptidoglycan biosynthesis regulator RodA [Plasticicumulans acidivorans]